MSDLKYVAFTCDIITPVKQLHPVEICGKDQNIPEDSGPPPLSIYKLGQSHC